VVNELEQTILTMLLAGEHPLLAVLREQLAVVEVENREFSGVGFFTELRVPPAAPRWDGAPRLIIGDVYAEMTGFTQPVGFLLFVNDGALDMLECFIHDDQWPTTEPALVRAYYVRTSEKSEVVETPLRDLHSAIE